MKNKVVSVRNILHIFLFFIVIVLGGFFINKLSYESNETEKWGDYNFDENFINNPLNLFDNYESFDASLGVIIANEWNIFQVNDSDNLVELLRDVSFFSFEKNELLKIDKDAIYGKYKTIFILPKENSLIRKYAIILIEGNVYLVRQTFNRDFAVFKAENSTIYKSLDDYFNKNFRIIK